MQGIQGLSKGIFREVEEQWPQYPAGRVGTKVVMFQGLAVLREELRCWGGVGWRVRAGTRGQLLTSDPATGCT